MTDGDTGTRPSGGDDTYSGHPPTAHPASGDSLQPASGTPVPSPVLAPPGHPAPGVTGHPASDDHGPGYASSDRPPLGGTAPAPVSGYPAVGGYGPPPGHPGPGGYPVSSPAGPPPPYGYLPPGGLPPEFGQRPPRRPRLWLWVTLGMVVALLCCAVPAVGGVLALDRFDDAAGTAAGAGAPSPKAGDPPTVTQEWLGERVVELLDKQATALLGGDEGGYLAVAEPGSPVSRDLRRQFRTLRAMQVTQWKPELRGKLVQTFEPGQWRADLRIRHCFVVPACEPIEIVVRTTWQDVAGQPRMIGVEEPESQGDRPRPWEVDELVASTSERVLVAAPRAFRDRLPKLLREADRAARIADRYAVDGTPPDRYRIFYAGPNEWKRWYGGDRAEWTAGYAVSIGSGQYDVVLNSESLRDGEYAELLRHELTHTASLSGTPRLENGAWWLVEGLAEYAAAVGRPVDRYPTLADVKRLTDSDWSGELDDLLPDEDAPDWRVSAAYGGGYLAVRHLGDRFGDERLLRFFKLVVHDGDSEEEAARQVFDADWSDLHDECVDYIRKTAD